MKLRSKQSVGTNLLQISFIQTKATTHRALTRLLDSGIPSLAVLAQRMRGAMSSTAQGDPFADVKKMVKQMIVKLMNEMAEEAEHKEWCDAEMSKSAKSKANKEKDVSKLKSRVEEIS